MSFTVVQTRYHLNYEITVSVMQAMTRQETKLAPVLYFVLFRPQIKIISIHVHFVLATDYENDISIRNENRHKKYHCTILLLLLFRENDKILEITENKL